MERFVLEIIGRNDAAGMDRKENLLAREQYRLLNRVVAVGLLLVSMLEQEINKLNSTS